MRKTLSIILLLAMLISLVPSVFASSESTETPELEVKYNFDFGAAGYGETAEIGYEKLKSYGDTTETYDLSDSLNWAKTNNSEWVVDGHYRCDDGDGEDTPILTGTVASGNKKNNALYWSTYGTRAYQNEKAVQTGTAAVRIKIGEAATYIPEITYYPRKDLAKYDVYLIPYTGKIGSNATYRKYLKFAKSNLPSLGTTYSSYILGTVDMYSNEVDKAKTETLKEVNIEIAGEYILLFRANGINEKATLHSNGSQALQQYVNIDSFKLLVEKEETLDTEFDYTEEEFIGGSATLRAFAVYGDGTEPEEDIIETRTITLGETVSVSAPKSVTKGDKTYNFLYWAKGATDKKQIVSYNSSFTYKAYAEANNLIAVYKEKGAESTKKEYYNANGQLLESGEALPSLPGYGKAIGWQNAGNGVFVAEYAPLEKDIEITVNGEKESYAYGDTVTCEADAPEGKVFMYWTKNDEIVSTESTYTFSAWKNATVTAVYGDEAPSLGKTMRKIVLDTLASGDYTAVMAEFIGFSDAVEKGIIFGGKKIPMLTDKSQFTLTNDTENAVTVTGYAIINDNGTLKEISDGSISVD